MEVYFLEYLFLVGGGGDHYCFVEGKTGEMFGYFHHIYLWVCKYLNLDAFWSKLSTLIL